MKIPFRLLHRFHNSSLFHHFKFFYRHLNMGHTLYWSQAWPAEKNYVLRLYRKNCEIMSLCISLENFSFSGKKKVSRETDNKYQAWGFKLFKRGF